VCLKSFEVGVGSVPDRGHLHGRGGVAAVTLVVGDGHLHKLGYVEREGERRHRDDVDEHPPRVRHRLPAQLLLVCYSYLLCHPQGSSPHGAVPSTVTGP
jgi:hypothetical protein